ncbi:DUF397 domain-containing protein [Spirillospora sp. CA-294931]|uniref:DUF397 domain-containing protein n=1 Tax=Spirillospora sp. CA-294931 TaxID=3240042 RepID=UPI003D930A82
MVDRTIRRTALVWRKSSTSADEGECVEVAVSERSVLVRDSRDRSGDILVLNSSQWRSLLRLIERVDTAES